MWLRGTAQRNPGNTRPNDIKALEGRRSQSRPAPAPFQGFVVVASVIPEFRCAAPGVTTRRPLRGLRQGIPQRTYVRPLSPRGQAEAAAILDVGASTSLRAASAGRLIRLAVGHDGSLQVKVVGVEETRRR